MFVIATRLGREDNTAMLPPVERFKIRQHADGWVISGPMVITTLGGQYSPMYDTGVRLYPTFGEAIAAFDACVRALTRRRALDTPPLPLRRVAE